MTCTGHEPHDYEPGDCAFCGHPRDEHQRGAGRVPATSEGSDAIDEYIGPIEWTPLAMGERGSETPDYMCPNCVTPWKCNGPHIPERRPVQDGPRGQANVVPTERSLAERRRLEDAW